MYHVLFEDEHLATVQSSKRRAGRLKKKWAEMIMEEAWNIAIADATENCMATLGQRQTIRKAAEDMVAPVSTKKKK